MGGWPRSRSPVPTILRATEPFPVTSKDLREGLISPNDLPKLAGAVAWHSEEGTGKVVFPCLADCAPDHATRGITFRTRELQNQPAVAKGTTSKSLPVLVSFELADVD